MPQQCGGKRRFAGAVLAGKGQRVEQAGLRHEREPGDQQGEDCEAFAGPGAGALQRIDNCQGGGARGHPKGGTERHPRERRRGCRERRARFAGRCHHKQQQHRGEHRRGAIQRAARRRQRGREQRDAERHDGHAQPPVGGGKQPDRLSREQAVRRHRHKPAASHGSGGGGRQ